jgi:hypothetical protein
MSGKKEKMKPMKTLIISGKMEPIKIRKNPMDSRAAHLRVNSHWSIVFILVSFHSNARTEGQLE